METAGQEVTLFSALKHPPFDFYRKFIKNTLVFNLYAGTGCLLRRLYLPPPFLAFRSFLFQGVHSHALTFFVLNPLLEQQKIGLNQGENHILR